MAVAVAAVPVGGKHLTAARDRALLRRPLGRELAADTPERARVRANRTIGWVWPRTKLVKSPF
jgi:hypothetical protein